MQNDFYSAKQPDNSATDGSENVLLNQEIPNVGQSSSDAPTIEINWEEEAKKHEQRWRTNEGIVSKYEKNERALKSQLEELRANEEQWQKRLSELESKLTTKQLLAPVEEDEEIKFTPEEEAEFAPATPYLKKLARLEAKQLFKKYVEPLTQEIGALKNNSKNLETSLASTDENTFRTIIKLNVPDHDQLVVDDNFKNYLSQRESPRVKFTTGDVLRNAFAERDLQTIVQIFKDFNQSNKQASNGLASMAAPAISGVGSNTIRSEKKLPRSAFTQAKKDFTFGKIKQEQFLEIRKKYDAAQAAGLVDENA